MNWSQLSSEIIDDNPFCIYGPRFHTVAYAKNSGLSAQAIVVRHPAGSVCQSWKGDRACDGESSTSLVRDILGL